MSLHRLRADIGCGSGHRNRRRDAAPHALSARNFGAFARPTAFEIHVAADAFEDEQTLFAPATLAEALVWKASHPSAMVVAGATEIGLAMSVQNYAPREILSLNSVAELEAISVEDGVLMLGARANWTRVKAAVETVVARVRRVTESLGFAAVARRRDSCGQRDARGPKQRFAAVFVGVRSPIKNSSARRGRDD